MGETVLVEFIKRNLQPGLKVASYVALQDEVSLNWLTDFDFEIVVPFLDTGSKEMNFVEHSDLLTESAYGFSQPYEADIVSPSTIGIYLVPGVLFDKSGGRLGRGGGFYDRYFASVNPHTIKIGIARSCEHIVASVPVEPHDHPMTHIFDGKAVKNIVLG